jgi:hypothetical protein
MTEGLRGCELLVKMVHTIAHPSVKQIEHSPSLEGSAVTPPLREPPERHSE